MLVRLSFHSETGTEGGYWATEDPRFEHDELDLVDGECPWGTDYCPVLRNTDARWPYHGSYLGMHVLETGDHLTIYEPVQGANQADVEVAFDGEIKLVTYSLFTEDAFGMWIHADQEGVAREQWAKWFMRRYWADLVKKDEMPPRRQVSTSSII